MVGWRVSVPGCVCVSGARQVVGVRGGLQSECEWIRARKEFERREDENEEVSGGVKGSQVVYQGC